LKDVVLVNNFLKENIASATGDGNGSFRAHKKVLQSGKK
jgi:hypothetical protein